MSEYKIVYEGGTGEIVEKKSRFIANVFKVESEDEALEIIEQTRKNIGMQGTIVLRISLVKTVRRKGAVTTRNRRGRQESRYLK